MCIVSFTREMVNITICNQYPGLELTSPVYYSNGTTCYVAPSQRITAGNIAEASFGIASRKENVNGALLYKLQRKYTTKTGNQPNRSTASTEDTVTNVYLLVVWNEDYYNFSRTYLIECTDESTWDEDILWSCYWSGNDTFRNDAETFTITWLTHGNEVVKIRGGITYGSEYRLDIVISEEVGIVGMKKPIKLDLKGLVLPLSMFIVLIYAVRLLIPTSIKLNIHNQCLNFGLASPVYVTSNEIEFHRPPSYKVCAGDTMRSGFIIMSENESYGALIYRLQRKQPHKSTEICEDTSSNIHLLVVWRIASAKIYTGALLVEYDRKLGKDDLKKLYCENINQFRLYLDSATKTWLLDDNIALMITFEVMNSGHLFDITISEVERNNDTRIPVHIALKR
jgi:hypothetical protein